MAPEDAEIEANRLLVIDDDPAVATVIGGMARRAGYDVIVTADPVDFRQRARAWRPSIIILDLAMPESDGIELLNYLADQRVEAHILIVSGQDLRILEAAQRVGAARGLNMSGVLQKPVRSADLVEALKRISEDVSVVTAPRLLEALNAGELYLEFQPKIDLKTRQPVGVEALVRWRHPVAGVVPPSAFIPLAEATGLIHQLTEWVLRESLRHQKGWADQTVPLTVSVNLSARNLDELDIADLVTRACVEHEVHPRWLILELTESIATRRVEGAMDMLTRIRLKGTGLSIDDFGTGYSSLVQLQRLPFSEVKIDRSFVLDCATSKDNAVIVSAIIDLSHRLGLSAVAEGVESPEALQFVSAAKCDAAQGYLLGRPMPGREIPDWFRANPVLMI